MKQIIPFLTLVLLLAGCGTARITSTDETRPVKSDGYMTTETTSIQHLEMKDSDRNYRTFADYIQANVGGVEVTPNGGIIIRGVSTFNGSTQPLILLDGMEVHDTSAINPNDIQSVDVIKDGRTATYGMRGANGVILITSKTAHQAKEAEREARQREKEAAKAARKAAKDAKKK